MSLSPKKQKFFELVRSIKKGKIHKSKVPLEVRKVAESITLEDVDRFIEEKQDLKIKKAVLSTIKDCREYMYLQENEKDAITKRFDVEGKFEEYVKRFLGQRFSEKEMEAVNNFQDVKPTKIESNQIRYEKSDTFKNNSTVIIKKLREGDAFVYVAFTKYDKPKSSTDQQNRSSSPGGSLDGLGGSSPIFERVSGNKFKLNEQGPTTPFGEEISPSGITQPTSGPPPFSLPPLSSTAPMSGATTKTPEERKKEMGIDTIEIKKSAPFKNDIEGGAILADFLKALDL